MRHTAVIMAGGRGERFWPLSRAATPKQFLSLTADGKTMLQLTVERLSPLVRLEDVYVVTNQDYEQTVADQLPGLPAGNILGEPMAKNTAPCIAYAAAIIAARHDDAVMYVLPSDHIVKNTALFTSTLQLAGEMAQTGQNIVTLGITPDYPETGYGYIRFTPDAKGLPSNVFPVEQFVEKPDAPTAQQYIDSGNYLWNSGMFCWKASTYLANLRAYLPPVADAAQRIQTAETAGGATKKDIETAFSICPSVSVDYGVMEKASNIYTIPGSFGWDDVGSWLSLARINPLDDKGNFTRGNVVSLDCENCIVVSEKRLVTAARIENLIVVETDDAVMICGREDAQRVKDIVKALQDSGRSEYL